MLLAHRSGLISASKNIYVTNLGNMKENQNIYHIYKNSKFIYEHGNNTALYEFPTLKKLEKYCSNNNDSLVWYAHSKGASYPDNNAAMWRHT